MYIAGLNEKMLIESSREDVLRTHCIGDFHMSALFDYEYSKDKIYYRMVNTNLCKAYLEKVPHIPYLDLSIVFYIHAERCEEMHTVGYVNNQMMAMWAMDEESLYRLARENMEQHLETQVEFISGDQVKTFVVQLSMSNQYNKYGAACILDEAGLTKASERLDADIVILPTSIHALLLLKDDPEVYFIYKEIVHRVNKDLPKNRMFSDNIYRFDRATKEITIV